MGAILLPDPDVSRGVAGPMRRWSLLSLAEALGLFHVAERLRGRRRRRRERLAQLRYSFVALVCGVAVAHATSVTPPSFPDLVAEAQVIARGTVTGVSSRWVDGPGGRMIKTFVDFSVEQRIKGTPGSTMTLEFLGGTVGADTLRVSGMPEFKVGESEIVFVRDNGVQFCPLVRLMHGRYHVRTDAASRRKFVTRDDDTPLDSVDDVQLPMDQHATAKAHGSAAALSPDDFATQIATEVGRSNR
jgi:hypothetical protein